MHVTWHGTQVARKMAHQKSLKPVNLTNCSFSGSILEPLDCFTSGEINSRIRLDVQACCPEISELISDIYSDILVYHFSCILRAGVDYI